MSFATRGSYRGQAEHKTGAMWLVSRRPVENWALASWQIPCGWCAAVPRVHVLWGQWGLDVPPDNPCPPLWSTCAETMTFLTHRSCCSMLLESIYLASPDTNCIYQVLSKYSWTKWRKAGSQVTDTLILKALDYLAYSLRRETYTWLWGHLHTSYRMWPPRLSKMGSKIFCKNV